MRLHTVAPRPEDPNSDCKIYVCRAFSKARSTLPVTTQMKQSIEPTCSPSLTGERHQAGTCQYAFSTEVSHSAVSRSACISRVSHTRHGEMPGLKLQEGQFLSTDSLSVLFSAKPHLGQILFRPHNFSFRIW